MLHAQYEPGSDCPGSMILRAQLGGRRRILDVVECDTCGRTNDPYVRRRIRDVWWRLLRSGRLDRLTNSDRSTANMKRLKLTVARKTGAPNYGSDGAAAELEIELAADVDVQQLVDLSTAYYIALERMVDAELARQAAGRAAAGPAPGPAAIAPPGPPPRDDARRPPPPSSEPPPPPPPPRNGAPSSRRDDPPRSGKELLGWAYGHGQGEPLKRLAKECDRGRIVDWGEDLVAWAYGELCRASDRAGRPAGQWGGASR